MNDVSTCPKCGAARPRLFWLQGNSPPKCPMCKKGLLMCKEINEMPVGIAFIGKDGKSSIDKITKLESAYLKCSCGFKSEKIYFDMGGYSA